jgi:hypothetical protein
VTCTVNGWAARRHTGLTIAVVAFACWFVGGSTVRAAGSPERAGDVVVVDGYDRSKIVTHGGIDTQFSLRLPAGAVCPGDSANDQWRVQSFMIPATDDPVALRYGPIGPEPFDNGRIFALFGTDTVPFVHELLLRNANPGHVGVIPPLPPFSFGVFSQQRIPEGRYRIGLACSYFGATSMYWDTRIVISESGDSKLGTIDWHIEDVASHGLSGSPEGGPGSSLVLPAVLAVAGLGVAGLGYLARRRRIPRRPTTLSKETS